MNKVLVVDDSATMRKIIIRSLRQANIAVENVLEAANGIEGLAQLVSNPDVGLVLTDVNMPEMNGLDFLRAIRANHAKEKLPVLLVTTEGGQGTLDEAIAHGANGLVCKPFTPESLRGALGPYCG